MSLPPSLWAELAPPAPACPPLEGETQADLVIIGAGFLGLSTALHAAQAGLDVRLLEAAQPGFGASGRNTGFVVPSLKSGLGPAETRALLGDTHADRLLRLVAGSGDAVFDLIAQHGIKAAATRSGWLQPGHSAEAEKRLLLRLPDLRDSGVDAAFLDRDEMRARTGLPGLHGGLRVASGGQLNPLAYARGLARAVIAAGARVHGETAVTAMTPQGKGWRVTSAKGQIDARQVLLTTNAMVGVLCPRMRQSIIPVKVYQVATQPLPAEIRARLLPDGAPVADTRRHTFALRWSEDHRLLTGGMALPLPGRAHRARRRFIARIAGFAPDLPPLEAEYLWSGTIAATLDALPRMIRLEPGLYGAIGCNGRGVALATALGRAIAGLMSGRTAEADFPLPVTPPRVVPFSRLSGLGPYLWLPWSELRDHIDAHPNRKANT
ncbi:FAD-binding oxidoreductase [Rhodophyticola sp. CCM32]|uniref:NAD(P)/FAD-dependent oxidoreductase n=1 Tax=Rhodophyticola sp. CCM32 TaxID=2916397 RepID=UPI00107FA502|nr:FAD-dependent oxidoreductase [Rhodophyticola sp. CCM32]QBY00084.1 FAD-binding oxidoreductase [Rhodophyticola sp. CCM32]